MRRVGGGPHPWSPHAGRPTAPARAVGRTAVLIGIAAALLLGAGPAAASQQPPAPATVKIDGPPPPVPPAVMARDSQGRVTARAVRVDVAPVIDGMLDDAVYRLVEPIDEFIQQEPREGEPATEATQVWVLFDRDHLYLAARCHDSHPERIVANDMRRDGRNIGQNDNLSFVIDTFYDRRNAYEFLVNAIGGMQDNQVTDERDVNRDWSTVWRSSARIDAGGWTVEIEIPFRSLRYRGAGPQVWGLNVRRTVRWKNEYSYLSPVPRTYGVRGILRISSAASLVGVEAPPSRLNLDVEPFVLGTVRADREVDPAFQADWDGDAGFDAKYGVTRGLTADFTFHTDFAQVEDDDQQVNLTRFSLFFPEKREFFLEGQGLFVFGGVETSPRGGGRAPASPNNTPILFYSRQIGLSDGTPVPITVGGRLTGKAGPYSVGLLEIQTSDSEVAGAPSTNFAVVRLKRDILRRSYVGVIGTRRSPQTEGDGANVVFGLDANFSFFESLNLVGFYAKTDTPGLDGDDHSYRARFDYDADLLAVQVERLAVGKHFNPEVGFLRRSDFIQNLGQVRVSRRPRQPSAIRKVSLEGLFDYTTDGGGTLENRLAQVGVRTEMQSSDAWNVTYESTYEFVPESFPIAGVTIPVGVYKASMVRGTYSLGAQRRVSGDITAAVGGFYDGDRTDVGYRGRVEVTPRLSVEPAVSVNWLDLPADAVTAVVTSLRGTYSFSPVMTVAALLQYNSTADLFSTNVRFRWEYRPGSDFFLVYTDGRDTLRSGFMLNRSFAAKLTRLIRF